MGFEPEHMATGRALLTDAERRYLTGAEGEQRKYEAASRVRSRIHDVLVKDIEHLKEYHPELYQELHEEVCADE